MSESINNAPSNQYEAFLHQLPVDWGLKEIKQIGTVIGGGTPSRDVADFWRGSIPWVTPGEVSGEVGKILHETSDHISPSGLAGSGANLLPAGSLLVTTRATLGARLINAVPMATNQGFKSIIFNQPEAASFYYHLFEKIKPELVRRASGTTFLEISGTEFGSINLPNPSPEEKLKIAKLLDTVDTAIHETKSMIVKLKALKQGLLHDLLTRGIDSNGELRTPWSEAPHLYKGSPLGWIPKEWQTRPIHEMGEVVTGSTPPSHAPHSWGFGVPFVTPGDLDEGGLISNTERQISEHGQRYVRLLPAGSSLVVCIGSTIGKVGFNQQIACTNQQINAVAPLKGTDNIFLFHALQKLSGRLQALAGLQAVPIVNKSSFQSIEMECPPNVEQVAMSQRVLAISERLQAEQKLLGKLRRQKIGLMDDLLSGRVRVTPMLEGINQGSA